LGIVGLSGKEIVGDHEVEVCGGQDIVDVVGGGVV
jgi:hypothetical protein